MIRYIGKLEEKKEEYTEFFGGILKKFNEFLKDSEIDDKKISGFTTSVETQRYKRKLDSNLFSILQNNVFNVLKKAVGEKLLTRNFVNTIIKEFKSPKGVSGILGGEGYSPEIKVMIDLTNKIIKKLEK